MMTNNDNTHTYPMKWYAQGINRLLGYWTWLYTLNRDLLFNLVVSLIPIQPRKKLLTVSQMLPGKRCSYLQVSPGGLVYRNYPFLEIRCAWEDVDRIKTGQWLGDSLFLIRADVKGMRGLDQTIGQHQIHLSSLAGWPDGGLKDDLQSYAPQLFRRTI